MPQDQDDIKGADAMKQAPTPGPPSGDDVKLLVKGDLLRIDGGVFKFDRPYEAVDYHDRNGVYLHRADGTEFVLKDGGGPKSQWFANLTFIGRPDADGWMPWSGGENPVPGQTVEWSERDEGPQLAAPSNRLRWDHGGHGCDIISFRLAPTAPVEDVSTKSPETNTSAERVKETAENEHVDAPVEASGSEREANHLASIAESLKRIADLLDGTTAGICATETLLGGRRVDQ